MERAAREQGSIFATLTGICEYTHSSGSSSCVPPARSTAEKKILRYRTRNQNFKRLEPHFQASAKRSGMKEHTENVVASSHSRECTKEHRSAPQIFGSIGTFGAGAEKQNALQENNGGRRGSAVCVRSFLCICGQCNTGAAVCRVCVPPRLSPYLERMYTYKKKALSCKRGGYRLLAILGEVYLTSSAALLDRADALQGYMRRVATVSV